MAKNISETTDYLGNFDPEWYLSTYYDKKGVEEEGNFINRWYHQVFNNGNLKGESLLDFGTGPTISTILTSSRYVRRIDLSDFAFQNLAILNDWKKGKRELVQGITKYEMKISKDERSLNIRNNEVREKVKNIRRVDVNKPELFVDDLKVPDQKYDIINTSLCLEAATKSTNQYLAAVQNLSKYLKSGGHIMVAGVLEQTFYRVGDYNFMCAYLTKEDITSTFTACNYTILEWKSKYEGKSREEADSSSKVRFSDCKDVFVMLARYNGEKIPDN
jgi:methyltransferase